jgi:hypothetical protein
MIQNYRIDTAKDLLENDDLRASYTGRLFEAIDALTLRRPFPEMVYLHQDKRKTSFSAILATISDHELQKWFLQQKLEHTAQRWQLSENARDSRLRRHVLERAEYTLIGVDGLEATKAYARVDELLTSTPENTPLLETDGLSDNIKAVAPPNAREGEVPDTYDDQRGQSWGQYVQTRFGARLGVPGFSRN